MYLLSYRSGGQKFKTDVTGLKIKVLADLCSFWGQGENPLTCLFQLLEAACMPLLRAPSSIFKASGANSVNFSLSLTFLPFSGKDPYDYLGLF